MTDQQITDLTAALPKFAEDKEYFHWMWPENGLRWAAQGKLDVGEVQFYNTPTGELQAYGPGIYLAEKWNSSRTFGPYPTVFRISAGTPYFEGNNPQQLEIFHKALGWNPSQAEFSEIGAVIPYVRKVGDWHGDWWVTHHVQNAEQIRYANGKGGATWESGAETIIQDSRLSFTEKLQSLKEYKVQRFEGVQIEDPYLEQLLPLFQYQDGLAFMRSMKVSPTDPWSQFEPENFERFKSYLKQIAENPKKIQDDFQLHPGGGLGTGHDKSAWVKHQVEGVLPTILEKVSGVARDSQNFLRSIEVQGGGDHACLPHLRDQKGCFQATPGQLSVLLKNPYLKVHAEPTSDRRHFLVSYEYPSAKNFEGVRNKLPRNLVEQLETAKMANWPDAAQTAKLTHQLIQALLEEYFSNLYGKVIDPIEFQKALISIHPFPDFNGRTTRLYTKIVEATGGPKSPPLIWSDFDLLMSVSTQRDVSATAVHSIEKLQQALLREMVSRRLQNSTVPADHQRIPEYSQLPEIQNLMIPLGVSESVAQKPLTTQELEWIRTRDLAPFLKGRMGPFWDISSVSMLSGAEKIARDHGLNDYLEELKKNKPGILAKICETNFPTDPQEQKSLLPQLQVWFQSDPEKEKEILLSIFKSDSFRSFLAKTSHPFALDIIKRGMKSGTKDIQTDAAEILSQRKDRASTSYAQLLYEASDSDGPDSIVKDDEILSTLLGGLLIRKDQSDHQSSQFKRNILKGPHHLTHLRRVFALMSDRKPEIRQSAEKMLIAYLGSLRTLPAENKTLQLFEEFYDEVNRILIPEDLKKAVQSFIIHSGRFEEATQLPKILIKVAENNEYRPFVQTVLKNLMLSQSPKSAVFGFHTTQSMLKHDSLEIAEAAAKSLGGALTTGKMD